MKEGGKGKNEREKNLIEWKLKKGRKEKEMKEGKEEKQNEWQERKGYVRKEVKGKKRSKERGNGGEGKQRRKTGKEGTKKENKQWLFKN